MANLHSNRLKWTMTLIGGVVFCAVSVTLLAGAFILPQQAVERFGAPDGSLTWTDNLVYSVQLFMFENDLKTPAGMQNEPASLIIDLGENASSVAEKLVAQNLITSGRAFQLYLMYSGLDRTIQAGEYTIEPGLNAVEIAHQIQDATPSDVSFTVLAGWRVEEIARAFPTSGLEITPEEFLQAVENAQTLPPLPAGWLPGSSLEGLFSPGSYTLPRDISLDGFISEFIKHFEMDQLLELESGFARNGLTFMEGVILASIVEKEAMVAEEQPMIASVFLNRLQVGMKLESDPTVQYAVGFDQQSNSWWKNPLTQDDLEVDSLYNTYLYPGLPPGPICSPSISALRAVAAPAQTDYFYFRAACDNSGNHNFSITYDEHLNNACP